jgi:succinate dehydrogenase/fumarate reductase flavoprotein subunit
MSNEEESEKGVSPSQSMKEREMAEEKEAPKKVSRKDFVKGAAVVAGVGALASCAPAGTPPPAETPQPCPTCPPAAECPKPWLPAKWDHEADVVVVGYGGAGATSALNAFDAGADVLILEKVPSDESLGVTERPSGFTVSGGGGNSCICGGGGGWVPDDVDAGAKYARVGSWGTTPMETCLGWAKAAIQNKDWFDEMGVPCTLGDPTDPEFPSFSPMKKSSVSQEPIVGKKGGGALGFYYLDQLVQSREIPILFDSPATDLIQDPTTKEILGVVANSGGTEIYVKAKRAVILCMGGFEYSERMKLDFLRSYPVHFYGWKWNTGDAIPICEKIGAGIWHMNVMSGRYVAWFPEYEMALGSVSPTYGIHVDKRGIRFATEFPEQGGGHSYWMRSVDFDLDVPEYTRIPMFYIFDEVTRQEGPVIARVSPGQSQFQGGVLLPPELGGFPYLSDDNSAEIERGWIQKGDTIEELAEAINNTTYVGYADANWSPYDDVTIPVHIDPAVLKETVTRYSGYAAAGEDLDFGRTRNLRPIDTPPFYAIPCWPGGPNTQGGPIRNELGQVCSSKFEPIPRLYSNGECGSFWGMLYEGGGDITELLAFGQISGRNAAAETPWE